MHKKVTRTSVLLIGVFAIGIVGFALAPPVLGSSVTSDNVTSADRTVESTVLSPGETTEVTVTATLDEASDVGVVETFDPAFAEVTILDSDGALFSGVSNANDELFAEYSGVTEITLVYEVTVPSDASDGDTFTISSGSDSDVDIDPATVEVDETTPFFQVSDLQPGDVEADPGESVDISATVTNTGDATAEQTVVLQFDGNDLDQTAITLAPDESETVQFTDVQLPDEEGQFEYAIASEDDSASGTFDTTGGNIDNAVRTPEEAVVTPGDNVTVTVDITANSGDPIDLASESFPDDLEIIESNSEQAQVSENNGSWEVIYLSPVDGDTIEVTYHIPDDIGAQTFELSGSFITQEDEFDTGTTTFTVTEDEPPEFVIDSFEMPTTVSQGKEVVVNATVNNQGELLGTQTLQYTIDGETKAEQDVSIGNNETETVSLTVDTTDMTPGSYNQSILTEDDNVTADLEVERSIVTYTDETGTIGTDGLRAAIADWRSNRIGTDLLRDVISGWRS